MKVQVTGKKATQVEVKVLPKNVLEVQVQSKQLYLKYRKKYFINSELFLIKTFNIQIFFYSLTLCPGTAVLLHAVTASVSGGRYFSNDVNLSS